MTNKKEGSFRHSLSPMYIVEFRLRDGEEFIPLISLLKATNVVERGSDAQEVVMLGKVLRNGVVEMRKRAKIQSGEQIEVGQYTIRVL